MKKILSVLIVLSMLSMCALTCYATEVRNKENVDYIYVDYDEFHGNRAYYNQLLFEGYAIIVSVGEEHAAEEVARLNRATSVVHELVPSLQRGTSRPTVGYDVHSNPAYTFTCNANYDNLYTNVAFYGCVAYLINGFNQSYSNSLQIRVYGTTNDTAFYVPARSTIYKVVGTASSTTQWFPMFHAPSEAYGQIYCIGH